MAKLAAANRDPAKFEHRRVRHRLAGQQHLSSHRGPCIGAQHWPSPEKMIVLEEVLATSDYEITVRGHHKSGGGVGAATPLDRRGSR